jgi:ubiquitin carboxyl-terminal hydrolase 7
LFCFFVHLIPHAIFNLYFLQIFAPSERIENINDQYWTLRAEEVMLFHFHSYTKVHMLKVQFVAWCCWLIFVLF